MSKIFNKHIAIVALALIMTTTQALALPNQHFATSSKLATGRWVKIAVPANGIYEITDSELQEMGFNNPEQVQIYGQGGNVISETLDGSYPDDLLPVSSARLAGKLCFYAQGATAVSIDNSNTSMPRYVRTPNTYSTVGYYFLTEGQAPNNVEVIEEMNTAETNARSTSLAYYIHEKDLYLAKNSGKEFLGEDIVGKNLTLDYTLPGIASPNITVNVAVAAKHDATMGYVMTDVLSNNQRIRANYLVSQQKVTPCYDTRSLYSIAKPVAIVQTSKPTANGKLNIWIDINGSSTPSLAKLDYFIITYEKLNAITPESGNQTLMGYVSINTHDRITLPGASASTIVWNIDNANIPVQFDLTPIMEEENITGYEFVPGMNARNTHFIAFDPEQTLKKITSFEVIDNQNLHALPTPDMLIITHKTLVEQAQRIAQLHKDVDNMDVTVVTQDQVFNEFSSGTPDAMAYRLLCKMFYDRDNTKFKNLLLFGPGSYDNRGILTNKANCLLTYQSDISNNQDNSYVSDDFFGILEDGTGSAATLMKYDQLSIGVGRIPSANIEEAQTDVDKLIKYVASPDYGPWRNDALISSDTGDQDQHIFEAENVNNLVETELGTQMQTNKVYVEMFKYDLKDGKTSTEARRRFMEQLISGQYFMTFVGHAGPLNITKSSLWSSPLAQTTLYPHLPIMSTACCEVARYDSDERGIAEHMLHKVDGGVIAMLGSTRETYAANNAIMNNTFTKSLFSYGKNGYMPTLGEVYLNTKKSFGVAINGNKHSYHLLGDPAIKINYPKPFFSINSINGNSLDSNPAITLSPMQAVTITAQVNKEDGSGIDTDFNGDAWVTLYDTKRLLKHVSQILPPMEGDVFYPRDVLAQIKGRVEAGVFNATIIVPRHTKGLNENAAIRVYAHQDGTSNMVNGMYDKLSIGEFDEQVAVVDKCAPTIDQMFINDNTTFTDGSVIPTNSTLYITASDDISINTQKASMGNSMKLMLDGGRTTYSQIKEYASTTNDGCNMTLAFPLNNLTEGAHTLTFTVFDMAGHSATRTISFHVSGSTSLTLTAQETPAVEKATFDIDSTTMEEIPTVNLKVTDAHGNLVWSKSTNTFPTTWDLTDASGNRVKAGLYKFYGNFDGTTVYGGTNIGDLIVIDPIKSNK